MKRRPRRSPTARRRSGFPRPSGRGLIEAHPANSRPSLRARFPRPSGRGLIEAGRSRRTHQRRRPHFRGLRVAASLKQPPTSPRQYRWGNFRGLRVAASLKQSYLSPGVFVAPYFFARETPVSEKTLYLHSLTHTSLWLGYVPARLLYFIKGIIFLINTLIIII